MSLNKLLYILSIITLLATPQYLSSAVEPKPIISIEINPTESTKTEKKVQKILKSIFATLLYLGVAVLLYFWYAVFGAVIPFLLSTILSLGVAFGKLLIVLRTVFKGVFEPKKRKIEGWVALLIGFSLLLGAIILIISNDTASFVGLVILSILVGLGLAFFGLGRLLKWTIKFKK